MSNTSNAIKHWPITEQPRERLLQQGANVLSDAELLSIFIRTGTKGQSAIDIARVLISQYGSLYHLLNCNAEKLMTQKGIGEAKLAQLQAALELGKRYVHQQLQQPQMIYNTPQLLADYLTLQLAPYPYEVFAVLYLNSQLQTLAFKKLFNGCITQCSVHIKPIMAQALQLNASSIVVCHNHPDAPTSPSQADIKMTQTIQHASQLLDIQLIDHIIIGTNGYYSFKQQKMI